MTKAPLQLKARPAGKGKVEVTLTNPAGSPVAFFNRLSLVDSQTKTRLLPVFYSDNYVSVAPGQQKTITMEFTPTSSGSMMVSLEGWNVADQFVPLN
jgi:hypothetical protein